MKLYQVQVTGNNPARYRGLTGSAEREAIEKAQRRHQARGFLLEGSKFSVTSSFTVIGSVVESDADTTHPVALNDGQLAEIEAALRERIVHIEALLNVAKHRCSPGLSMYQVQLKAANSALDAVVSV